MSKTKSRSFFKQEDASFHAVLKHYLTNEEIKNHFLKNCSKSPSTRSVVSSSLNHFFEKESQGYHKGKQSYYGFEGHCLDIDEECILKYFGWLDDHPGFSKSVKKNYFNHFIQFVHHVIRFYKFPLSKKVEFYFLFNDRTCLVFSPEKYHKKPKNNHHVRLTKKETESMLLYLQLENYRKYREFRTIFETGMRKGELINVRLSREYKGKRVPLREDLNNRFIIGNVKKGEKAYYFSKDLQIILLKYLNIRETMDIDDDKFFLNNRNAGYKSSSCFNTYIKGNILPAIGIDPKERPISPHCIRRTLNTLRKKMGCDKENRQILLNHKTGNMNLDHYVVLNKDEFLEMHDKWNPYKKYNYKL